MGDLAPGDGLEVVVGIEPLPPPRVRPPGAMKFQLIFAIVLALTLGACNRTQTTLSGAITGGLAGAVVAGPIGAAVGAGTGAYIGARH